MRQRPEYNAGVPKPVLNDEDSPSPSPSAPKEENLASGAADRGVVRIGMWGASHAGKSTFLAAIPIAAAKASTSGSNWIVTPIGDRSQRFARDVFASLVERREFPVSTRSVERVTWRLYGRVTDSQRNLKRWAPLRHGRTGRRLPEIDVVLELFDVPGESFLNMESELTATFATMDGLLYLYDPVRSSESNVQYFAGLVSKLALAVGETGGLEKGRLPQFVAVCIPKLDRPDVFRRAIQGGWLTATEDLLAPSLALDKMARAFFMNLCVNNGPDRLILDLLANHFHDDRLKFFLTSAVGFHRYVDGKIDVEDPSNVTAGNRIRGDIFPFNVLEPIIWLEQQARQRRRIQTRRRRGKTSSRV